MDDPRFEPGMPVLDRQGSGPPGAGIAARVVPSRVPEPHPTPLQQHYVLISAPALVLGAVAITAVEAGASPGSLLVKACVLLGAPLLAVANADAIVRIWRSAWAWLPVDRGRAWFRFAWTAAALLLYAILLAVAFLVLAA